jgi:hypothetical protein
MIVILCGSFKEASKAFESFLDFLLYGDYTPEVTRVWVDSNCVETDEDLRYIFVEHGYGKVFESMNADLIDICDFFEDFDAYNDYYGGWENAWQQWLYF